MATDYPISINSTQIKTPTDFKVSRYNLTKSGRLASGKMVMELIAKKKKLFLNYAGITGRDLRVILNLIDTSEMFFNVAYYDVDGTPVTNTCYVGEISSILRQRAIVNDDHIWKDVEFNFIEQ